MENKRRRADGQGCEDCPPCYNLVQDAVNQHRKELKELDDVSLEINFIGLLRYKLYNNMNFYWTGSLRLLLQERSMRLSSFCYVNPGGACAWKGS